MPHLQLHPDRVSLGLGLGEKMDGTCVARLHNHRKTPKSCGGLAGCVASCTLKFPTCFFDFRISMLTTNRIAIDSDTLIYLFLTKYICICFFYLNLAPKTSSKSTF